MKQDQDDEPVEVTSGAEAIIAKRGIWVNAGLAASICVAAFWIGSRVTQIETVAVDSNRHLVGLREDLKSVERSLHELTLTVHSSNGSITAIKDRLTVLEQGVVRLWDRARELETMIRDAGKGK